MNTLSIIKAVSLPTADHRSESWEITFSESIDQIPDEIIKKAALSVSWLWMPSIRRTSTNSVIFSGYID
jgi:hypothetical protein